MVQAEGISKLGLALSEIDGSSMIAIPGIIDMHVHITGAHPPTAKNWQVHLEGLL